MNITDFANVTQAVTAAGFTTTAEAAIFFEIARAAEAGESPTMTSTARNLGLTVSTTSRVIYSLCRDGWLKQVPHPTDRRVKLVQVDPRRIKRFLAAQK